MDKMDWILEAKVELLLSVKRIPPFVKWGEPLT
jgi:hypothetical protein